MTTQPAHEPSQNPGVPEWTLGDRLRKARRITGMTTAEMAEAVGVTLSAWSNWETGVASPKDVISTARAVARVTGVRADWLVGLYVPDDPDSGGPELRRVIRRYSSEKLSYADVVAGQSLYLTGQESAA